MPGESAQHGADSLMNPSATLKATPGNSPAAPQHFAVTHCPDNLKAVLRLDNAKKRMLYLGVC